MSGIIKLLSDAVANQIAAGEVVQRPASVVKELLENAIDAGSSELLVSIKNGGKTLIQISDNGSGIYPEDIHLAFERHATSKISKADDLFALQSFGFRGEALASIASVARVEMKSRPADMELGSKIIIEGSKIISVDQDQCSAGTHFFIKDLFFNIPARRNFLKSNQLELKYIWDEVYRVCIPNYNIQFEIIIDDKPQIKLLPSTLKQRIVNIMGKQYQQRLIPLEETTDFVKISGFLVLPEYSKKQRGDQYFFVNGRFIKSAYLNAAIQNAYAGLIPPGEFAGYFIFIDVDPAEIDINIHPTKTEIKFRDERMISAVLASITRRSLGLNNASPSIDFSLNTNFFSITKPEREIVQPGIKINPNYNPFEKKDFQTTPRYEKEELQAIIDQKWGGSKEVASSVTTDASLFSNFSVESEEMALINKNETESSMISNNSNMALWVKNRFIFTVVKSGTMIIDAVSAMERIIYERFSLRMSENTINSQQLLFPITIELPHNLSELMGAYSSIIKDLGFTISQFNSRQWIISGVPAEISIDHWNPDVFFSSLLSDLHDNRNVALEAKNAAILALARKLSLVQLSNFGQEGVPMLIDQLFASSMPEISPSGKRIFKILDLNELENLLK